jgi:hypothetical protein
MNGNGVFRTPYNVVAAFRGEREARRAVDTLTHRGVPVSAVRLRRPGAGPDAEELAAERAELQDELDESWPVMGMGIMTRSQAKGALVGTVVLGAVGLVLGIIGGLVWTLFDSSLDPLGRVVVAALTGAAAVGTAGFFAGGGLNPRLEAADDPERPMDDRRTDAERDFLVGVHVDAPHLAEEAAKVLIGSGADRVHCVDAAGTPLPPQAAHPRPADPEGWWWRRAGRG